MSQSCIYLKRPPQTSKKGGYDHKGSKFQGVDTQYFVFLHMGGIP